MKLYGILFAVLSATCASATEITLVNKDGFVPFYIDTRVVFFITTHYRDNEYLPAGTSTLSLVTVDCKSATYRSVMTEINRPDSGASRVFENDQQVADANQSKKFAKLSTEIQPIADVLCKPLIK